MSLESISRRQVDPLVSQMDCWRRFALQHWGELQPKASQIKRRLGNEEGAGIVEFALSTVLLLTLLFGVIAICFALYTFNVVSEAAREGTRFAIVRGSSCVDFPSACPATQSDIQNYVKYLGFPGINPANMTVTATWSSTNGTACIPSSGCNNPSNQVLVTVTYNFPLVMPFAPARTFQMSNSAQMVISQ